ncbi:hypothetical protein GF342_01315 [Candidatus Woesearchaeota archaeon]|nr:hypothetical protein [Candidatus Woesearchaeota archaeon]
MRKYRNSDDGVRLFIRDRDSQVLDGEEVLHQARSLFRWGKLSSQEFVRSLDCAYRAKMLGMSEFVQGIVEAYPSLKDNDSKTLELLVGLQYVVCKTGLVHPLDMRVVERRAVMDVSVQKDGPSCGFVALQHRVGWGDGYVRRFCLLEAQLDSSLLQTTEIIDSIRSCCGVQGQETLPRRDTRYIWWSPVPYQQLGL